MKESIFKKIKITNTEYAKCYDFAYNSGYDYEEYIKKRNQTKIEELKKQNLVGKLGEIAVYKVLKKFFKSISKPDFKIYDKKDKDWSSDLSIDDIKIGVKSQNKKSAEQYGVSWIFNYRNNNNRGGTDDIFVNNKNDIVCFVSINLSKKEAEIRAICSVKDLKDKGLFEEPVVYQLRHIKKAVYLDNKKKNNLVKSNLVNKIPSNLIKIIKEQ